jgi:hypothetical protein
MRRGRIQDPAQATRNSSKDVEEAMQQQYVSNTQDESDLSDEDVEDSFSGMDVDIEAETPHSSIEERAGLGPPSGSNSRGASHAMDTAENGETPSMDSVWGWPDFTSYPLVFDEEQLSLTLNTGSSSSCSNIPDASLSTPSYSHSGYGISATLPLHEMDFSALDNRTTDTAQAFQDHGGTSDDLGAPPSLMLESTHNLTRPPAMPTKKGHVTISLKQVDAKVAQDITSSLLKYNDSLVIQLYIEWLEFTLRLNDLQLVEDDHQGKVTM